MIMAATKPANLYSASMNTRLRAEQRRRAERSAPPRSPDDRTMLLEATRPATPAELRAFVEREQARSRSEQGLPPIA
jgi:hypothetical protein